MKEKARRLKQLLPAGKNGVSICWKLGGYLFLLLAILLIIIWTFQVLLLDILFEHIQKREMLRLGTVLAQKIDKDDLELFASDIAIDSAVSVLVYKLDEGNARELVRVDLIGDTEVFFRPERIHEYYRKAALNDGSYAGKFAVGGYELKESPLDFLAGKRYTQKDEIRLISTSIVTDADGGHYVILMSAALLPLNSMVRTWNLQFAFIAALMFIAVAVTVYLLYRKISKPLISMNNAAKELARGNYEVQFSGLGYRETRELAGTLNYAANELSKLDHLQKELIANISHDLRTPLTMIKGYGEVMRDLPGENTPENIQIVIDETSRLSELVDDLLDLSRIQSGTRRAEVLPFSMTALIRETMGRYDAFTHHKGYRIDVQAEEEIMICADRGMILQVLYNLINNAINYTGEDLLVTVSQTRTEGGIRISVSDTGEGIDPEQLPLIWERYYKEDKAHRRAVIGTGLGLSIVKEILELHGYAYGVNSTKGKGSTFWFEFPEYEEAMGSNGIPLA